MFEVERGLSGEVGTTEGVFEDPKSYGLGTGARKKYRRKTCFERSLLQLLDNCLYNVATCFAGACSVYTLLLQEKRSGVSDIMVMRYGEITVCLFKAGFETIPARFMPKYQPQLCSLQPKQAFGSVSTGNGAKGRTVHR